MLHSPFGEKVFRIFSSVSIIIIRVIHQKKGGKSKRREREREGEREGGREAGERRSSIEKLGESRRGKEKNKKEKGKRKRKGSNWKIVQT